MTVLKPEQGTAPKLYYIGGEAAAMHPTATERTPRTFAWTDVLPISTDGETGDGRAHGAPVVAEIRSKTAESGAVIRTPQTQGVPLDGPIMIGEGRMAEQMVQVVYNAQHKVPWHWPVPAYLVTKGISAGLFMILSLGAGLGLFPFDAVSFLIIGFLSLLFIGITTGLLVIDLERPERFLRILTRPQWKSWLVRGAYLLIGFSMVAAIWWVAEITAWIGWIDPSFVEAARPILLWIGFPLALGSTVYTAFLFGQAEGRDLWQSPLLPVHLIVQAFLAGSAMVLISSAFVELDSDLVGLSRAVFGWTLALDLLVTLMGEFAMPHASEIAARAAREITHGRNARTFWAWGIVTGRIVPLALLLFSGSWVVAAAGILALIGG